MMKELSAEAAKDVKQLEKELHLTDIEQLGLSAIVILSVAWKLILILSI
jgi:hypothetical protein